MNNKLQSRPIETSTRSSFKQKKKKERKTVGSLLLEALDSKSNFDLQIEGIVAKVNTVGQLRTFQCVLPRSPLITIYQYLVRIHLDYCDTIFDQALNNSYHQRMDSTHYGAALSITGLIRGTSKKRINQELGFESLQSRRCFQILPPFLQNKI